MTNERFYRFRDRLGPTTGRFRKPYDYIKLTGTSDISKLPLGIIDDGITFEPMRFEFQEVDKEEYLSHLEYLAKQ